MHSQTLVWDLREDTLQPAGARGVVREAGHGGARVVRAQAGGRLRGVSARDDVWDARREEGARGVWLEHSGRAHGQRPMGRQGENAVGLTCVV